MAILVLLIALIPLGIKLLKDRTIFFSRANIIPIALGQGECVIEQNGEKVLKCKTVPLILTSPLGGVMPPAACSNLVKNGSFETPVIVNTTTNNSWQLYGSAAASAYAVTENIPDWDPRVEGAGYQVELQKFTGFQYAEIDAPGKITLTQSILTEQGKSYQIKFKYSPRPDATEPQKLGVYWNGQEIGTIDGTTHGSTHSWTDKTFNVIGITGTSKLGFGALAGTAAGAGNLIDDISVIASGENCTASPSPAPTAHPTLGNGLLSYWKFDETSGNTAVDFGAKSNGFATNATIVDGKFGKARQIAAADSYINAADHAAYATDYFTVGGWVKPTTFGIDNYASIFSRRSSDNTSGMTFEYAGYNGLAQGQLQCVVFITKPDGSASNGRVITAASHSLQSNVWNHVACSYDGNTIKIYINGTLVDSTALPGKMRSGLPNTSIRMGQNPINPEDFLNGIIDEIMLWNRALTQEEITALASGVLPTNPTVSPSPSPSPSTAPTTSPTATPAPVRCQPRPNIGRVATMGTQGQTVTLTAVDNANTPNNPISSIQFTSLANGTVTINNQVKTAPFTHTVAAGTNTITFLIKQVTYGQATTILLKVNDTCGPYDLFFGGGTGAGWPNPNPTPTPAPIVSCSPRPGVDIASSSIGGGKLRFTVSARTNAGSVTNKISSVTIAHPSTNLHFNGQTVTGTNDTLTLTTPAASITFDMSLKTAGVGGGDAFLTVNDSCGSYQKGLFGAGTGSYVFNFFDLKNVNLAFNKMQNEALGFVGGALSNLKNGFIKPVYAVTMPTVTGTSVCLGDTKRVALSWDSNLNPDVLNWNIYRQPDFVGFPGAFVGNYTMPFSNPKVTRIDYPLLAQGDPGGTYTYWLEDAPGVISNKVTVTNNATCTLASSITEAVVPAQVASGAQFTVRYTFKNTGTIVWPSAGIANYDQTALKLMSNTPFTPTLGDITKSIGGISLNIYPNQTYTFEFPVTAPTTPGTYDFNWQLNSGKKNGFFDPLTYTPFGAVSTKQIVVGTATATPTPVPTPSPTPLVTPTAVPTPTPAPVRCQPRPNIGRTTSMGADGMTVTLTAVTNSNTPNNPISSIDFTRFDNGTVTINNQLKTAAFNYPVATGTNSVTFLIKQVTYGQPTTIFLKVNDTCGPYELFFGGGTEAGWPVPPTAPPIPEYTVSYRLASTEAGLATAEIKPYTSVPVVTNFDLPDEEPGNKQIWVQYITNTGKSENFVLPVRMVNLNLQVQEVNCTLDLGKENLKVTVKGKNFGANRGKIKANTSDLRILDWNDTQVVARFDGTEGTAPVDGTQYSIKLTREDAKESEAFTCTINRSEIALGAKVFCRDRQSEVVNNVEVTILDENGIKVIEKVSISPDGLVQGIQTKLVKGQRYLISIKAPYALRRNAVFTASEGTTVVLKPNGDPFFLPTGDIAPVNGVDGKINTADRSELIRQWKNLGTAVNKTGDLYKDNRVNSLDWACMRYDFNQEDEKIPATVPTSASLTIPSPTPILRTPVSCPVPTACPAGQTLIIGDPVDNSCPQYRCSPNSDATVCTADSQCQSGQKCFHYQNYEGTCKPENTVCTSVVTRACKSERVRCIQAPCDPIITCVNFPNPCVVPPGWSREGVSR